MPPGLPLLLWTLLPSAYQSLSHLSQEFSPLLATNSTVHFFILKTGSLLPFSHTFFFSLLNASSLQAKAFITLKTPLLTKISI